MQRKFLGLVCRAEIGKGERKGKKLKSCGLREVSGGLVRWGAEDTVSACLAKNSQKRVLGVGLYLGQRKAYGERKL